MNYHYQDKAANQYVTDARATGRIFYAILTCGIVIGLFLSYAFRCINTRSVAPANSVHLIVNR